VVSGALGPRDEHPGDAAGHGFDYDLLVVGGGSGGLATAKRAADLGANVALCDFVSASPAGSTWGLGGTCVNVGCIPKKLMHTAALHGEVIRGAPEFGWALSEEKPVMQWDVLQQNVENYIRGLNFNYVVSLRSQKVKYLNAAARFVDPHTLACTNKKGEVSTVTARRIVLAPGGRPTPLQVPGAEHAISSDDIFKLKRDPGATVVVGSGYIGLECAGFLNGIQRAATVMMRSIPLRGMDTDCTARVVDYMEQTGVRFLRGATPSRIDKTPEGRLAVTFKDHAANETRVEEFDTVLVATGRTPQVQSLALHEAGVETAAKGHIVVDEYDRASAADGHIYAVGDAALDVPELTPVAIQAGQLLAERLFNGSAERMDYKGVATAVFTPLEYAFVGLSEEQAEQRLGADAVAVYHKELRPLEWTVPHLPTGACYMKMVVEQASDKVIGFHLVAPNAGEIVQAASVALRLGATKRDFDRTVGVHPTVAETMTTLDIKKGPDTSPVNTGGC
jgi:thioredoxin reductase (NADPH)